MAVDKLVDSSQLDGYFTNIASAIRSKAGVSSTYTPSEMPQAIEDIPSGGGGDDSLDQLVARTITTASGSATNIGVYAFAECRSLTTVIFTEAETVDGGAFTSCVSLHNISLPNVKTVYASAFAFCSTISEINFPKVVSIFTSAFWNCKNITTVYLRDVKNISATAFARCNNLLSLYLMGSSVPVLSNTNAFSSTPISNYTTSTGGVYGSIFVPASLYSSYLTATNWSLYSNRFVSVAE